MHRFDRRHHFHHFHTHGRNHNCSKGAFGALLVIAGGLLLAFNLGYLPSELKSIIFSWPMLLLAFGLVKLFCGYHRLVGLLLTSLGLYWLAPRLGYEVSGLWNYLLPFLLVGLGIRIAFNRRKILQEPDVESMAWHKATVHTSAPQGRIDENAYFGGIHRRYASGVFQGGEVNCVLGGGELDLSAMRLNEGTTILEVNCVLGGFTLIVPESWTVRLETRSVFGDFLERENRHPENRDPSRILLVRGSCVLGGGEVRYWQPNTL